MPHQEALTIVAKLESSKHAALQPVLLDVAFPSDSWSACPARRVIPEMLRIAWRSAHHRDIEVERLLSIHNWSRLWRRVVSRFDGRGREPW